ncbi:hypothetical protein B0T26DRAFT_711477 [Lasiosphaeria miniovina]|uniref:Uncharacterized protein n=1 Tax=Lasiosphaeria miniovina TaxID=1954250 RepID=A0AA40ALB8_9PEZI|nr:uncharacterized protein B0T26DRAFT_711477 [Lasiosphaeria miniovina]KAK0717971.1 hypothetical protein B0T26DRAFT_711477 [Lasiosphaeria miniovina]
MSSEDAFQHAQYENNTPSGKINGARLDSATLAPLILDALASHTLLLSFTKDVDQLKFRTSGSIRPPPEPTTPTKHDSHESAAESCKLDLQMRNMLWFTARPTRQLGQMAVQSGGTITFVWENIFCKISEGSGTYASSPRTSTSPGSNIAALSKLIPIHREHAPDSPRESPLLPVAEAMFHHLESYAMDEEPTVAVSLESPVTSEVENVSLFRVKMIVNDWMANISTFKIDGEAVFCSRSHEDGYTFESSWAPRQESNLATLHFFALGPHLGIGTAEMTVRVKDTKA